MWKSICYDVLIPYCSYFLHMFSRLVRHIMQGGNDFEIFNDARTIGHTVKNPEDTMRIMKELFF